MLNTIVSIGCIYQWRKRLVSSNMRQKVISLVPEHASLFESSIPAGVWGGHRSVATELNVDFVSCGLRSTELRIESGLSVGGLELLGDHVEDADMIVVPTWPVPSRSVPPQLVDLLIAGHDSGARIVGLCLGAFVVAATGLLDERTAVTHWRHRELFETRFPAVTFEPNTLYVDHGSVVTSAGSAAAIDCCLHLVRTDHGAEAAASVARSMVAAPHRAGAQSQFAVAPPIAAGDDPLANALAVAASDIALVGSVGDLARIAKTSRRSLERHIQGRLGVTPRAWLNE
ncbi:MAG: GlxA family transcriptional regulator, partial [bacterium]|nr:GlxA family transcriptional regulator [bacterium]